jgi:hypothetical protein
MVTDVALDTFHVSVEDPPDKMLAGFALKKLMTGKFGVVVAPVVTVTWVVATVFPAALIAIRM